MNPIEVSSFEGQVPHRHPMVWVDQVLSVDEAGGECRVKIDPAAHYAGKNGIRESSIIEWIAQSYAYVRAAQLEAGFGAPAALPKTVFLAAVRNARFDLEALQGARALLVRVACGRIFGPLALVDGQVFVEEGMSRFAGAASLKVFAE